MRFLICLLAVAMLIPAAVAAANPPADLEARRKALNDLLARALGIYDAHQPNLRFDPG